MSVLTAEKAERILSDAPEQHHFRLHMGTNIRNLKELAEALEIMADRTFFHHVGDGKNDFSSWIKEVVGDPELAEKIKKLDSKNAMVKTVRSRLHYLETKPSEYEILKNDFMRMGINDFAVGALVGFIVGVIIAAVL